MTDRYKKMALGGIVFILIMLLIIGIMIFKEGMKGEFHKDSMAADYFDVDRALNLKNQCDKSRDGDACLETARYYLEGKHVHEDRKKAAHYLARSCRYNNGDGCFHLGTFWYEKNADRNSANNKRALTHFKKACSLGVENGCRKIEILEGK